MAEPVENAALVHTVGRSRITLSYADILTIPAEVIVSSDDVELSMSGGVSQAIRNAAGEAVREEARKSRPAPLGSIVVTSPGALEQRFIFHAAVLDYSLPEYGVSEDVVRSAVRACFQTCATRRVRSIAFPALATGTARLSPEQSASAILIETFACLETQPTLEEVHIVLYKAPIELQRRFFLKAQQYLALRDTALEIGRAVEHYQQFAATPSRDGSPPSSALATVGETLNAGLMAAPTDEFSGMVAPLVARTLNDEIARVQAQFASDPDDRDNVGFRAHTLRLQRLRAFSERQILESENTRQACQSDERTARIQFLQAQEEKFSTELAQLEASARPVVITIHGIRTRGAWQKQITPALNYAGFTHVPLDFGHFGLFRFLRRSQRQAQVDAFRESYRVHGRKTTRGHPSLIAHSLGSYIVTEAMAKYDLRFDRMVLCGAIVKRDYDWDTAHAARFVTGVLNDHGRLDIWARVAELVLSDAGQSGLKGFTRTADGRVLNRDHARFGHSDYFYEQNYLESWIPFLLGQAPPPLTNLQSTRPNHKVWVTLAVLVTLALVLYGWFR